MLLLISGPSTIGKDSVWIEASKRLGFEPYVAYSTRKIRPSEQDGVDYHFITNDFQRKIRENSLAEWDYVLGNYYGTDIELLKKVKSGQNLSLVVLARMGIRLQQKLENTRSVLLMTDEQSILEDRLISRGYSDKELILRTEHGINEMALAPMFDYVIDGADIFTRSDAQRSLVDILGEII